MFTRRNIFLLITLFFLQSCSTLEFSKDKTLLSTTSSKLEKKYNINHAELVVLYNLTNKNNKYLYAKNLGVVINDPKQNKIFLQKFHASFLYV